MRRESRADDIASERALQGAKLAAISVVAGALATLGSLIAVAFLAAVGEARAPAAERTRLASLPVPAAVRGSAPHPARADDAGEETRETHIGAVTVVDVAPNVGSLDDELARQQAKALVAGQRLVVWLVVEDCEPCAAVDAALPSKELQRAVGGTRFARVNAAHFIVELSRMGAPVDAFPGFFLLGPQGFATDYVHGGEWGADVPQNIAPVLKSFVDGTYSERRSPWRGGLHEDETPL